MGSLAGIVQPPTAVAFAIVATALLAGCGDDDRRSDDDGRGGDRATTTDAEESTARGAA